MKLELYKKFFVVEQLEKFPTKKSIFEKLKSICDNSLFKEMVVYGLLLREKERVEEKTPVFDPPNKNAINLKEIKQNPKKLDEMFAARH